MNSFRERTRRRRFFASAGDDIVSRSSSLKEE